MDLTTIQTKFKIKANIKRMKFKPNARIRMRLSSPSQKVSNLIGFSIEMVNGNMIKLVFNNCSNEPRDLLCENLN